MLRTCWRQKILVTLFVKILFSKKKSKTIFSYHALDYKMVCQRVLFLHALLLGTIWNILLFMNHKSLIKGAFNGWFNLILPSLTIQWNAYLVKIKFLAQFCLIDTILQTDAFLYSGLSKQKIEKKWSRLKFWRASEKTYLKKLIEYFLVQWSECRFMNALWLMDAFHDISSQCSLQEPH